VLPWVRGLAQPNCSVVLKAAALALARENEDLAFQGTAFSYLMCELAATCGPCQIFAGAPRQRAVLP
jgi:hypothetical protein